MKESYAVMPEAVEAYCVGGSTDVILRKNITEVTKTDGDTTYNAWECDEVQFRYPGTLTKAEVEADFDSWWDYPTTSSTDTSEDETASIAQQITDLQVALCEVYELLAAADTTADAETDTATEAEGIVADATVETTTE